MKHGVHPGVRAFVDDPKQVRLSDTKGRENLMEDALKQLRHAPVFSSPAPIQPEKAEEVLRGVLESAGCSHKRDAVDQRIISDVRAKRFQKIVRSQDEVGGWPSLTE